MANVKEITLLHLARIAIDSWHKVVAHTVTLAVTHICHSPQSIRSRRKGAPKAAVAAEVATSQLLLLYDPPLVPTLLMPFLRDDSCHDALVFLCLPRPILLV